MEEVKNEAGFLIGDFISTVADDELYEIVGFTKGGVFFTNEKYVSTFFLFNNHVNLVVRP